MLIAGMNNTLRELEEQRKPVKVSLIGLGEMGTDILAQISLMQGIRVLIGVDVTAEKAEQAARSVGYLPIHVGDHAPDEVASKVITHRSMLLIAEDWRVCTECEEVDVVVEATGRPEVTVRAAVSAINHGKHFVTLSVESDITVGHILYWLARQKGVVYTLGAGDEPPAIQELYEFANALGLEIVAAGKGKNNPLNRWATPADLLEEAQRRGVNPYRLTEFVDGTKTMVEMACVSNATGLVPDVRGMHGPKADLKDLLRVFALREQGGILTRNGVVEYAIGDVAPAVFLIFTTSNKRLIRALNLRTMGTGPNYLLVRPFHLCSMEVPLSAVAAAVFRRPTMCPYKGPIADVMTVAKTDLPPGTVLDQIGGPHYFGLIERAEIVRREGFLPIGLAEGCTVIRQVKKGEPITLADVEPPETSVLWKVWKLQQDWLSGEVSAEEVLRTLETLPL